MRPRAGELPEFESELAELTAKFSSHEGGQLPAELSVDLALEVVLHEIVEQACAATGASSAAVILQRDGAWVCRASTGTSAPELGARLSSESGLIAECIRTCKTQRCDDSQADPRMDPELCRNLGIRSAIALPVIQRGTLLGVLAAFSPRAGLFKDGVTSALWVFSQYVLSSVAQAAEPAMVLPQKATPDPVEEHTLRQELTPAEGKNLEDTRVGIAPAGLGSSLRPVVAEFDGRAKQPESGEENRDEAQADGAIAPGHQAITAITWVLAAAVLAFAVLLTTIAGERLIGKSTIHHHAASGSNTAIGTGDSGRIASTAQLADATASEGAAATRQPVDPRLPRGGLVVYENGKEVFREGYGPGAGPTSDKPGAEAPANAVEPAAMYELAPATAEGRLVHRVEPDYPETARSQGIQGQVVLQVVAGHDGAVENVSLIQGDPVLAEAAIAAVKQWRFRPLVVSRSPVEIQTTITLNFRLPER